MISRLHAREPRSRNFFKAPQIDHFQSRNSLFKSTVWSQLAKSYHASTRVPIRFVFTRRVNVLVRVNVSDPYFVIVAHINLVENELELVLSSGGQGRVNTKGPAQGRAGDGLGRARVPAGDPV